MTSRQFPWSETLKHKSTAQGTSLQCVFRIAYKVLRSISELVLSFFSTYEAHIHGCSNAAIRLNGPLINN